jgi:hypothetical protein
MTLIAPIFESTPGACIFANKNCKVESVVTRQMFLKHRMTSELCLSEKMSS